MDVAMLWLKKQTRAKSEENAEVEPQAKHAKPAGKGAASAASTAPPTPRPSAAAKKRDNEIVNLIARLSLGTARQVATLEAAIVTTVVFANESMGAELVAELKDTTQAYTLQSKALPPQERSQFSAPHTFVWLSLTSFVETQLKKEPEANKEDLRIINLHFADIKAKAAEHTQNDPDNEELKAMAMRTVIALQVKICRSIKCYNPQQARIQINVERDRDCTAYQVKGVVVRFLEKHCKGSTKSGPAPKSDLERRIQSHLDATGRH